MFRKSSIWLIILVGVVSLGIACDQADEANKFVDEANATVTKSNEMGVKAANLTNELLGENMTKAEDLEEYKTKNKAKFDELLGLSEQAEKARNEAAGKFEQATKLKVDEKFKEYLNIGIQELKKRAESDKLRTAFVKAFLAEKEAEKIDSLVGDYNKNSAALAKEADDLGKKADQMIKDNPNVFKKT